jgi:hypothetical protein
MSRLWQSIFSFISDRVTCKNEVALRGWSLPPGGCRSGTWRVVAMVPPPWDLVAPDGEFVVVANAIELRALGQRVPGMIKSSGSNLFMELVDASNKKALHELPQHRGG